MMFGKKSMKVFAWIKCFHCDEPNRCPIEQSGKGYENEDDYTIIFRCTKCNGEILKAYYELASLPYVSTWVKCKNCDEFNDCRIVKPSSIGHESTLEYLCSKCTKHIMEVHNEKIKL